LVVSGWGSPVSHEGLATCPVLVTATKVLLLVGRLCL